MLRAKNKALLSLRDYGVVQMAPALVAQRTTAIYTANRTMIRGGINADRIALAGGLLSRREEEAPPYGWIAAGTGLGAVASGVGAYYVSGTAVKVLLGALSVLSGGAALYSTAKSIQITRSEREKRRDLAEDRKLAKWLGRVRPFDHLLGRNVLKGTSQQRVDEVQIRGFEEYNRQSTYIKFQDYTQPSDYPDWIKKESLTVGVTDHNEVMGRIIYYDNKISQKVENAGKVIKGSPYASFGGAEGADMGTIPEAASKEMYRSTTGLPTGFNPVPAPGTVDIDPETGQEVDAFILYNNYGHNRRDVVFRYRDFTGIACSVPPLHWNRPLYYHYMVLDSSWTEKSGRGTEKKFNGYDVSHQYWNAANFSDIKTRIGDLPSNALVAGTRIWMTPWSELGRYTQDYSRMTYEDYVNLQLAVLQEIESRGFPSPYIPSLYSDCRKLRDRPDLSFLKSPIFPCTVTSGSNSLNIMPFLGKGATFLESRVFQELGANYRWFIFSRDDYASMISEGFRFYRAEPKDITSISSFLWRLISTVVSLVVAVVGTVFGQAEAWAAAITVITVVWSVATSMISRYLEGGTGALVGGMAEDIAGLWGDSDLSSLFEDVKTKLLDHFGDVATLFKGQYKNLTGIVFGDSADEYNRLMETLMDVAGDMVEGRGYINAEMNRLFPTKWRDITDNMARRMQTEISGRVEGTIGSIDVAKRKVDTSIIAKIRDADKNINSPGTEGLYIAGMTKFTLFY